MVTQERKNPGKPFPGVYFPRSKQHLRWSHLKQEADAETVLKIVRDEVFLHFRTLSSENSSPRPASGFYPDRGYGN